MSVARPTMAKPPARLARLAALPVLLVALGAPMPRLVGPAPVPAAPSIAALAHAASAVPRAGFLDYREAPVSDARLDAARLVNARIPFAKIAMRTAAPFFIAGDIADRARATDCLAAAGYYEAGDDVPGQRAVMQVVLNRMRHPRYPRSVCGVVFQGSERSTGCQFTFTCDGAMGRHRPSIAAWERARRTAIEALSGYADPRVGHATHYHTDWVHPYWSSTLDKIAAVDTHLFFQARWEKPSSFSAAYAGAEPRIARLRWLSSAHQGAGDAGVEPPPVVVVDVAALPEIPTAPAVERLSDSVRAPGDEVFLVTLDAGADPNGFLALAQARCAGRSHCRFIGWTDPRKRAQQMPIPGSAIDAISFSFNRIGGEPDKARWNCSEFPRADAGQCLRRGG